MSSGSKVKKELLFFEKKAAKKLLIPLGYRRVTGTAPE
jgi:hypothetical protein